MNFPSRGQNLAERRSFGYLFCVKYERLPKWAQSLTKLCFKYLTHFSNILKFTPSLNPYPLPEKSLNCTMKTRLTCKHGSLLREDKRVVINGCLLWLFFFELVKRNQ